MKMTDILGLNWWLLFGFIGIILSMIFIVIGLYDNVASKTLFNISRLLALLSVAGIWFFGNILTKNTTKEIETTKTKTAEAIQKTKSLELKVVEAKKETEIAKKATANVKLKVEQVNKETQEAKLETGKLKLEAESAKAEAEKARLERDKLKNQTKKLKIESERIKVETDRIKSLFIVVKVQIPDDGSFSALGVGTNFNIENGNLELQDLSGNPLYSLQPNSMLSFSRAGENILIENSYSPYTLSAVNTNSIKSLEDVEIVKLRLQPQILSFAKDQKIIQKNKAKVKVIIYINQIQSLNIIAEETQIGDLLKDEYFGIKVPSEFDDITKNYNSKIGRDN